MDIDPNDFDFDLEDQFARMAEATRLLREIGAIQQHMRWQFGENVSAFNELVDEMKTAQQSWVASNC